VPNAGNQVGYDFWIINAGGFGIGEHGQTGPIGTVVVDARSKCLVRPFQMQNTSCVVAPERSDTVRFRELQ